MHPLGSYRPGNDTDDLLRFACSWAPYGGPSDEEIFVYFGITRGRFIDRLWQLASSRAADCSALMSELTRAYPRSLD
ncbi:hypothetical protein AXA44_45645 [Rhodococcus sp. SC4]|nr:hypothetical protein AXA44_45645 [Rhodococcus sp. SC4]